MWHYMSQSLVCQTNASVSPPGAPPRHFRLDNANVNLAMLRRCVFCGVERSDKVNHMLPFALFQHHVPDETEINCRVPVGARGGSYGD